jgi:hypothetical protein
MSIILRVKALGLPLNEIVVIGSGLLDALELRNADDIDLAVSERLFNELARSGEYEQGEKHGERYLLKGDTEIWASWGRDAPFESLKATAERIDDVMFVNRTSLIEWKIHKGRVKDLQDVELLKGVN